MPYTQDNREFQFTTPLKKDKLLFYRMQGNEQLGQPFEFHLDLLSEDGGIALDTLVGQPVSVLVTLPEGGPRYFHGIVTEFGHTGAVGELELYRAVLRPEFWLLTHTAECRIFQEKTVPEIIKDVLKQRGLTDYEESLTGSYRKWDYCVQYRESDFQFLSRLMQQEGIYYYFKHEEKKQVVVCRCNVSKPPTAPPQRHRTEAEVVAAAKIANIQSRLAFIPPTTCAVNQDGSSDQQLLSLHDVQRRLCIWLI